MRRTPWDVLRTVLRRATPAAGVDPPPDAELLDRFVRSRDEAAFELMLWRHASLVLGVCRRIVRDDHLAEDAFQATFLVLARKAGSVRRTASLAGWLHRVARRVAVRAAKKRTDEAPLAVDPMAATFAVPDSDLRKVIDQEIDNLPDRYRLPVVLCYVQEHTTEEAARLLGVPRGTILSRLATAREKLACRLTRRGVTAPAGGLVVLGGASAGATDDLIQTTFRAAAAFATGSRPATTSVLLATEVLRMAAWKTTAGVVIAIVIAAGVSTGFGVVASDESARAEAKVEPLKPQPQKPAAPPTDPHKERAARRERQLRTIDNQYAVIGEHIRELTQEKRKAANQDEVDVKALRILLDRLDEGILATEDQISAARAQLRIAAEAWEKVDTIQVEPDEVEQYMRRPGYVDQRVSDAHDEAIRAQRRLNEHSTKVANPDADPFHKKLQEEQKKAETRLGEARHQHRADVVQRLLDNKRRAVKTELESAKAHVPEREAALEALRKKRVELVKRVAIARVTEEQNQLIDDELRVYREIRQQLLRQRLLLRLEADGVTLPSGGSSSASDARVDQLTREIEELKSELRRLAETKEAGTTGKANQPRKK